MANTKTAKKEIRKNARRVAINKPQKTSVATFAKKAIKAIEACESSEAVMSAVNKYQSVAQKLAKKNTINKKAVSRKVSRLTIRAKKALGEVVAKTESAAQ